MNKSRYHLAINIIEFPDDMRLILLKSCSNACLECQVTVAELKKKHMYAKSIDFQKKICSPAGFKPAISWMQVSHTTHWAIGAVVFNGMLLEFSPLLHLQPAAECNLITTLPHSDKLEVGRWWVCGVWQLICQFWQSQTSYWCDR